MLRGTLPTMKMFILVVSGLGLGLLCVGPSQSIAQDLVVTPSERVTRYVNIRDAASADGERIGRLHPGESLPYVRSHPRWHEVQVDDDTPGFVSKSWTAIVPQQTAATADELRIHFLSVGAGTCTVVECPGQDAPPMIIDCGSGGGRGDMALERDQARQRVQEILSAHDVAPNVVLSHGDVDHYRWIQAVLGETAVGHIWQGGGADTYQEAFPGWLQRQRDQGAMVHQGFQERWHNDGDPLGSNLSCGLASTYVLTVNSSGSKNTNSLVLMIEYNDFTAIFPGDAVGITEEDAEANFIGAVKATVLSGSHHGAETHNSNSDDWVAATSPEVIVYSSGERFGHPRCSVTTKYAAVAAPAANHQTQCNDTNDYDQRQTSAVDRAEYVTDVVGSIVVTTTGSSPLRLTCDAPMGCDTEIAH